MITSLIKTPVCYQTYGEVVTIPRKRPGSYEIPQDSIDRVMAKQAEISRQAIADGFEQLHIEARKRMDKRKGAERNIAGIYAANVIIDVRIGKLTIDEAIELLKKD